MVKIHGLAAAPQKVTIGTAELPSQASIAALQSVAQGWAYDQDSGVAWVRIPDRGSATKIEVAR